MIALETGAYRARFLDRFDAEARSFEDRLRAETFLVGAVPWPRVSFRQGYRHLETGGRRCRVLQLTRRDSGRSYQIAVVERSSKVRVFKNGEIPYWIPRPEPEARGEQVELLLLLRALLRERTTLMSVRAHAYVPGEPALDAAQALLEEAGFAPCAAEFPSRTRLLYLRPPLEEVLAALPSKIRTKLRLKKPDEARAEALARRAEIPALKAALNDAFRRSTESRGDFDFEGLFAVLEKHPEAAAAFGFYLSDDWSAPKAFVSGTASPPVFEYSTAGSLSDPRLRRFPFNYVLLWKLVEAAKARGARTFDMGGITDGGPDDPLAGISEFKRRFPGADVAVGRELRLVLRPARLRAYEALRGLKGR